MRSILRWIASLSTAVFVATFVAASFALARGDAALPAAKQDIPEIAVAELPSEARETLKLMQQSGPFPYERDGVVFGNFEKRLPLKERGYYREYTVRTLGVKHRGARRIVAGREGELYYTEDHYQSFKRIRE